MKKSLTTILIALIALTGVALMLYPAVSDYLNSLDQKETIDTYKKTAEEIPREDYENLLNEAREYNAELAETGMPSALSDSQMERYLKVLDVTGTGIMGYIDIPKVGISLPIYHTAEDQILQSGVGHIEWSSLPVGGENTHTLLSGHRGLPSARLFTDIDDLQIGDTFTITILNEKLAYKVDDINTVLPEELSSLKIEDGKDYCTLVTCTPYGINTHRLLVRGVRVPLSEVEILKNDESKAARVNPLIITAVAVIPIVVLAVILVVVKKRKQKNKQ